MHETSIKGDAAIHRREEAKCPFAPYVCSLYRRAIFQNREKREDGTLREISVLEEAARFADDCPELEVDGLKMGT